MSLVSGSDVQNLKGELPQLRDDLDSSDARKRKVAAKRVVQIMRGGENVGELFTSMLRCVKTDDVELKRLVYLYLVHYSLQESEQSIMIVNTIIQDSQDGNPLVRALALRTMSRIHIEGVAENMIIPLKQRLEDPDPYVRKTAALSVAKLYDIVPDAIDNANMYTSLIGLLEDTNPLVIANAAAAILEINAKRPQPIFSFKQSNMNTLFNAVGESNEWCQAVIFDAIASYKPVDAEEAAIIIERMMPFLRHSNPAVVIGSFKCIFQMMQFDPNRNQQDLFAQIIPPFMSLVTTADPEIQYVVLRTLTLFVTKFPGSLAKEIRFFFCKYNDPSYIKMQKLDIITANCSPRNAQLVLDELNEYCNEIDVQFVKKTIKAIGDIALRLPSCARRCVDILVNMVEGKAEYSVEQAIIVLSDILRKFPGQFESVIGKVCGNVEQLKDPDARASLIWILGEYNNLIENVDVIIDPFIDTFSDEAPQVQLQLISTLVKIFLDNPDAPNDQLQFILNEATKESVLPDVRNRALVYWRMISMDRNLAKDFVLFPKGQVDHSGHQFTDDVLNTLILNMGMASGVLHIMPTKLKPRVVKREEEVADVIHLWRPVNIKDSGNSPVAISSDWDGLNYYIQVTNKTEMQLNNFAVAVNLNAFGLELSGTGDFPNVLSASETAEVTIPYKMVPEKASIPQVQDGGEVYRLDFALRIGNGVIFYTDNLDFRRISLPSRNIQIAAHSRHYGMPNEQISFTLENAILAPSAELQDRNIVTLLKVPPKIYLGFTLSPKYEYVAEITSKEGGFSVIVRGDPRYLNYIKENARYAFCN